MKQLIRQVLPHSLVGALTATRDSLRFAMAPKREFAHLPLRPTTGLGLNRMFVDDRLAEAWRDDHEMIARIFGDDEKGGGVNRGDRRAIHALTLALQPERMLEVGTHIGASTLYVARALARGGPRGHVVTVDIVDVNDAVRGPWKTLGLSRPPRDLARELSCDDRITFIAQPAQEYLAATSERFDLIFLDGDHSPRAVYNEVAAALRVLRPGGVILLHDYYPGGSALFPDSHVIAGPYRALERIRQENPAIVATPLGQLPWPTKQGSQMTSLALVSRAG
jgi:predicted O-methyltransferase YrrM